MARFETLDEIFFHATHSFSENPLFGTKRSGRWEWMTYAEFGVLVYRLRAGLAALGVTRGDRVAIISNNRPEWAAVAYATFGLGAALVPMYEAQAASEWEFIVRDSAAKVLFVATEAIGERIRPMSTSAPELHHIVSMDASTSPSARVHSFAELATSKLSTGRATLEPAETACLLYTSGTTGHPKGVVLSHGNIASNVSALRAVFPVGPDDRTLSFLPWAHSFGQVAELHTMFSIGASVALVESVDKLLANLTETKPTILVSVPRIFNRLYVELQKQLGARPPILQSIVQTAVAAHARSADGEVPSWTERAAMILAHKLVFARVRARFGGQLRFVVSGGAALSTEVAEFIDSMGIEVYEGYGLTETGPVVAVNRPNKRRIGSVGNVLSGVQVRIDENSEIVVYGPNVMKGYLQNDEANANAFTSDGGFRTGDLGRLDDDGFLFITGRSKEQYKLENGKYVVPTPLEEQLKLSPYVVNAMVYGDNRPYNVALIVANVAAVREWAAAQGVGSADQDALLQTPEVRALFADELRRRSETFKHFELVKDFVLLSEDFTTENGLLTPSLKVRRERVLERYGSLVDELYTSDRRGPISPPRAVAV